MVARLTHQPERIQDRRMTNRSPTHSERYDEALLWTAQLHRAQARKGKEVPDLSHLLAGLLHDSIVAEGFREAVDAGQSQVSEAAPERIGP